MRIVCQKCSAAYAIDDKFVTPKGVRAQCPRCRHLQLVKKDDAAVAAPAAAAGAPSAFLFDMGAAPPAPSSGSDLHFGQTAPAAGANAASPFDFTPPTNPGSGLEFGSPPPGPAGGGSPFDFGAAPGAAGSPFDFAAVAPALSGGSNPFDFGAPPPGPGGGSPFGNGGLDLGDAAPPPKSSGARAPSFPGKPPENAAPELALAQTVGVKCRTCGKEMLDPFDQALGVCDDCRNKSAESATAEQPALAPRAAPPPRLVAPSTAVPLFPPANTPISAGDGPKLRSAARDGGGNAGTGEGKGRVIGMALAAVAVIAIVAGLVIKKPWAGKPPPLVVKSGGGNRPVD